MLWLHCVCKTVYNLSGSCDLKRLRQGLQFMQAIMAEGEKQMGMVQCCMACVVNQADMRFDPCKIAQHNCQKPALHTYHRLTCLQGYACARNGALA